MFLLVPAHLGNPGRSKEGHKQMCDSKPMPLPFTVCCFGNIQIGLPFWYRLTRVIPDKVKRAIKQMCVCVQQTVSDIRVLRFEEDNVTGTSAGLVLAR